MLLAAHRGDGQSVGTPDVCNTPSASGTTPVSYVNTAQNNQATAFSNTVTICSQNALHLSAGATSSSGDESGTAHATIKGRQSFTTGSAVVFIEGQPAVSLTSTTAHNNFNCPAGTVTQPSTSTVFYTRRIASMQHATACHEDYRLDKKELARFRRELSSPALLRPACRKRGMEWWILRHFGPHLPAQLAHALRQRTASDTPLLLDLRGNPGGRLDTTLIAAGLFVGADVPAGEVRWSQGGATQLFTRSLAPSEVSVRASMSTLERLILLTDGSTASAAEHFVAILRRYGAKPFGKKWPLSFGKDAVQQLLHHEAQPFTKPDSSLQPAREAAIYRRVGRLALPFMTDRVLQSPP